MAKQTKPTSNAEIIENYKLCFPIGTKENDPTLQKAFDEEPIFVLRALDETAPTIILEWIKENIFTAPENKLRSAFEQALAMSKFEDKRRAD